jgi:hypothetical protein
MRVEWQGDHKLLDASGEKQDFEGELKRLGHDPGQYIVVVRREPEVAGSGGLHPIRYKLHVTRLVGSDQETLTLSGGEGNAWVAEFARDAARRDRSSSRQ